MPDRPSDEIMSNPTPQLPDVIPKTLHFVWIGDESKCPHHCIDSWRKHNPEYEVRIWGNHDYRDIDWQFKEQMARIHETGQLYGVADMMRWEILYRHGGIALDADAICLAPLPDWLHRCTAFACWQNELSQPGLISNGYVGTAPGNALVGFLLETLKSEKDLAWRHTYFGLKKKKRSSWKTTGPGLLTRCFQEMAYRELTILPSHFFIPLDKSGGHYRGSGPVFAMQLFGSTKSGHINYERMAHLSTEQIIELINEKNSQ